MFWSANYIVVRELKSLLKEENVTLTQILEADDILQECKADNQELVQFLTRPDILAELITLITEEPPKNVELSSQYRHANIASEVLTSNLSKLRDRLSMDGVQMNRLCDFVNRDPPLNPLLASYFSKTIEMLLERTSKQDWYLHHIVCLHVLDVFKSRHDFMPNLLRHMSTSAISDTFKCFLRLGIPFNKIIFEWLEEHQFLESLIAIICGTYDPAEALAAAAGAQPDAQPDAQLDAPAGPGNLDSNHNAEIADTPPEVLNNAAKGAQTNGEGEGGDESADESESADEDEGGHEGGDEGGGARSEAAAEHVRCVAAFNAAALLCDIAVDAASDPFNNEYVGRWMAARLRGEETVRRLLQGVFTSPPRARRAALVNACRLLLTLLSAPPRAPDGAEAAEEACAAEHGAVERAVAPHLPLLHHALLHDAPDAPPAPTAPRVGGVGAGGERVGAARVSVAALVARLALSEVDDVPTALISLGTAGVLVELLFRFPHNNFLHAQVCALVRNARANRRFSHRYTAHLIEECDLLTRLMDAFEENEHTKAGAVRAGYMGHVVGVLRALDAAPPALPSALQQRWDAFRELRLRPLLQRHDTPLGGVFPWENNSYESGPGIQVLMDSSADTLEDGYDFNETATSSYEGVEVNELTMMREDEVQGLLHLVQLITDAYTGFEDEPWGEAQPAAGALQQGSPWESAGGGDASGAEEGWAQFDAFADPAPVDPFAPLAAPPDAPLAAPLDAPHDAPQAAPLMPAMPFWSDSESGEQAAGGAYAHGDKDALTLLLAQKMLSAFHMAPDTGPPPPGQEDGDRDHRPDGLQDAPSQFHPGNLNLQNSESDPLQEPTDVQTPSSNVAEEISDIQNPQTDIALEIQSENVDSLVSPPAPSSSVPSASPASPASGAPPADR